jgi:glycosyltransferase involved in cell wall biosynthesis
LLWVGNDFRRKGGEFLVSLFSRRIHPKARLHILSNDPVLETTALPEGVEWIRGLRQGHQDKIAEHFRNADIFVFPTLRDHLAIVLLEAASSGLPIVGADVGATSEAVRHGENGYLLPRDASEEVWAEKIQDLIAHPEKRAAFGRNSRALAERDFSLDLFRKRVTSTLDGLLEKTRAA